MVEAAVLENKEKIQMPDIRGFLPSCLNEWDGRIAAVIFLAGCNMRCPFCHGWRFVTGLDEMPKIDWKEVYSSLDKNDGWVDGVVISGGEPTLSPNLENLIDELRDMDLQIKLHTNGLKPEIVEHLLKVEKLNCLALDFKAPLKSDRLKTATGVEVDEEIIKRSFTLAANSGIEFEFHTTLCPISMSFDEIELMGKDLKEIAPNGTWHLQQYNPEDVLDIEKAGTEKFDLREIEKLVPKLEEIYSKITLHGA
jgi:pyruvate formate lyase activating enzyme